MRRFLLVLVLFLTCATSMRAQRRDSVVYDTIFVHHDTTYVVDSTFVQVPVTVDYAYYDYYCNDSWWDSFDCQHYLYRPYNIYIPRYRRIPRLSDRDFRHQFTLYRDPREPRGRLPFAGRPGGREPVRSIPLPRSRPQSFHAPAVPAIRPRLTPQPARKP